MKPGRVSPLLLAVGVAAALVAALAVPVYRRAPAGAGVGQAAEAAPLTGTARFVGAWKASDSKMSGDCEARSDGGPTMVLRQTGPNEVVLLPSARDPDCQMRLRVDGSVASSAQGSCQAKGGGRGKLTITYSNLRMRTEDGHSGELDVDFGLQTTTATGAQRGCTSTVHAKLARTAAAS
jgi:hypothetical protein